jgi:ATP-dependent helicase/nuclease subunit A
MSSSLSNEQQAVIDAVGKMTTVSAGAGAGKTRVMIARYLDIIRRSRLGDLDESLQAGVSGILTLTFTEDAAGEIKKRLVEALMLAGLVDERREIETAYISTIHGFCSRLLKENPFEAGLDPQFRVIEPAENNLLLQQAFDEVISDSFANSRSEVIGLFRIFSTSHGFGQNNSDPMSMLRRETLALYDRWRSEGRTRADLQSRIAEGPEGILAANQSLCFGLANATLEHLRKGIDGLAPLSMGAPSIIEATRELALSERDAFDAIPTDLDTVQISERMERIRQVRSQMGRRQAPRLADASRLDALKASLKKLSDDMDGFLKAWGDYRPGFERHSAYLAHGLLVLAGQTWNSHDRLKRDRSGLDFSDLQSYTRDLLASSPSVLARYQRRLRHIMVDEFQDTDGLQKQILDLLRSDRNLFCVGDPKQSIYGFRNADVTIFRDLVKAVSAGPGEVNAHRVMQECYRSRPEIIAFVNYVFAHIGVGDGIEYEPLTSAASFTDAQEPSVELLLAEGSEDAAAPGAHNERTAQEASLVARRIREIVDEGRIRITADGPLRGEALQYSDFMILLRSFTPLPFFERALARNDVDYYVVGGRGYYALDEIRDVMNVLKVICNPLDDLSLASALRSPFCGLSYEALYHLARLDGHKYPGSLYAGAMSFLDVRIQRNSATSADPFASEGAVQAIFPRPATTDILSPHDEDRLVSFWSVVQDLRSRQDRTRITLILEQLLERTLYEARLLLQPQGRRKMANVRKLVASASQRDTCGVADFLNWLSDQSRIQEKEGEAPTEEEAANVVRVRTIHGSKGLEANVVVVAGMSKPMLLVKDVPHFVCDLNTGAVGVSCLDPATMRTVSSGAHYVLRQRRQQRELDESLRLLYVAMTRAREHLILAGIYPCRSQTWLHHIIPHLGIRSLTRENRVLEPAPGLQMSLRSQAAVHVHHSRSEQTLLERIQTQMRSGDSIDPSDLANLQSLGQTRH